MTNQPSSGNAPNLVRMPIFRCIMAAIATVGGCLPLILLLELMPADDVPYVGLVILVMALVGALVHERFVTLASRD